MNPATLQAPMYTGEESKLFTFRSPLWVWALVIILGSWLAYMVYIPALQERAAYDRNPFGYWLRYKEKPKVIPRYETDHQMRMRLGLEGPNTSERFANTMRLMFDQDYHRKKIRRKLLGG